MYQLWIDTGGTFTDGLALAPNGSIYRTKVLSSSRLRGQLLDGKLVAPWLTAPIFDGYQLRILATDAVFTIASCSPDGQLHLVDNQPLLIHRRAIRATTIPLNCSPAKKPPYWPPGCSQKHR